jgi:hypothetical protein
VCYIRYARGVEFGLSCDSGSTSQAIRLLANAQWLGSFDIRLRLRRFSEMSGIFEKVGAGAIVLEVRGSLSIVAPSR